MAEICLKCDKPLSEDCVECKGMPECMNEEEKSEEEQKEDEVDETTTTEPSNA
ncbi:hypothetical protein OnM2_047068 [Erysiphe neolycopersici]|uniref:Uncharacterized protein n=1 Tax=Erysiphe neolycopersici TaxID=212602 RepID=A0A420HTI4_9PEZI|nr:hypothetical protein OnM2_047068 [Erysiphe neolycopersici]